MAAFTMKEVFWFFVVIFLQIIFHSILLKTCQFLLMREMKNNFFFKETQMKANFKCCLVKVRNAQSRR
jgi:hypothetical protein